MRKCRKNTSSFSWALVSRSTWSRSPELENKFRKDDADHRRLCSLGTFSFSRASNGKAGCKFSSGNTARDADTPIFFNFLSMTLRKAPLDMSQPNTY